MTGWQESLYNISLMKKEKVRKVSRLFPLKDQKIYDLGCSAGVVSCQLKKNGGDWVHGDLDFETVKKAAAILGNGILQQSPAEIPMKSETFSRVLALDFLEHVTDDDHIIREIHRILSENGQVAVSTPISGGFFFINKLKKIAGLKPELYGHVREGYSLKDLREKLEKGGFQILYAGTYAKLFVEFFEFLLNTMFIRMKKGKKGDRSGVISPQSSNDLKRNRFLLYSYSYLVYPVIRLICLLDRLLWFKTGYATLVIARKTKEGSP